MQKSDKMHKEISSTHQKDRSRNEDSVIVPEDMFEVITSDCTAAIVSECKRLLGMNIENVNL